MSDNNARRPGRLSSFFDFIDATANPFSDMNPLYPELTKLQTVLTEVFKNSNKDFVFRLLPITDEQLAVQALVIMVSLAVAPEKGVGYHTVLLEALGTNLPPRFVQYQGGSFEIEPTLGDVYDRNYVQAVNAAVRRLDPDASLPYFDSGARALYRVTNLDDAVTLHRLAADIAMAASTQLLKEAGQLQELDLTQVDNSPRYALKFDYSPMTIKDSSSMPVRRDAHIALVMQSPAPAGTAARDTHLGDVGGFVDVIPLPNQRYLPRFVITQLEARHGMSDLLSVQMLMLAMAGSMIEQDNWYDALIRPNLNLNTERHWRLEALFGKPLVDIDEEVIQKGKVELFTPGLVFSLDVGAASAGTWRTDVWAAAAHGHEAALETLYRSANQLTGGRFEQYFQPHSSMVLTEQNVIPMGYYYDRDGLMRDTRDIDHLVVMGMLAGKDPRLVDEWRDTYMRTEIPYEMRVAKRKSILRSLLGKVHFTDSGTRVSFTSEFIRALMEGVRDTGFMVRAPSKKDNSAPEYPFGSATIVGDARPSGIFRDVSGPSCGPHRTSRW